MANKKAASKKTLPKKTEIDSIRCEREFDRIRAEYKNDCDGKTLAILEGMQVLALELFELNYGISELNKTLGKSEN